MNPGPSGAGGSGAMSMDDLASSEAFGGSAAGANTSPGCPEPAPREQTYTVISVDDHVVEPPDAFTGRFPRSFGRQEPHVSTPTTAARHGCGRANSSPTSGSTRSSAGPRPSTASKPTRFDEMRPRRVGT